MANIPTSAGRSRVPLEMMVAPCVTSSPLGRMLAPLGSGWKIRTLSDVGSVYSTRTTVSAPSGTGAPVMMRIASPGPTVFFAAVPACTSSIIFRTGSFSISCSFLMSSHRTAKPSIAELFQGGLSLRATISSPNTRPNASRSPTFSQPRGSVASRTVFCASLRSVNFSIT